MFVIGSLSALTWYYVTENDLIKDDLSLDQIIHLRKINLVLPAVSLLALGLAFVIPSWSSIAYLLIPILLRIIGKD
jgi:hypothetical protein